MKRIALTLMAILLVTIPVLSQDSQGDSTAWKSLTDIPTGRCAHSATVFDGKIYVFGGIETDFGPFATSTEVYDPESDKWSTLTKMPTNRSLLSTCLVDRKIYAIGGFSNPTDRSGCKTVEVYNPISDSWSKGTDMPLSRLEFHSCVFNGKIYVFGGLDASEKGLTRVEVYDPESETWTALADMPTGRCGHSCIVKDSLIYVFGGTPGVGPYFDKALNVVEIYNPRTDTWEEGVEMPDGKSSFSATLINNMLYTFGGTREFPDSSLPLFEIFDFSNNKWLSAPDIPTARKSHTASLVDGKIYVIGGSNVSPNWPGLTSVEVFTPGDRIVSIPDTAFLHALIEHGLDTNKDSLISYGEAEEVTEIYFSDHGITDMTGIEAFASLKHLWFSGNLLSSLDVSGNTKLVSLDCSANQLSSLNILNNDSLRMLDCSNNQLSDLDVSNNMSLTNLLCSYNQLASIDLTHNIHLYGPDWSEFGLEKSFTRPQPGLDCSFNSLSSIDVSSNTKLVSLNCGGNQLSSLDLTNDTAIQWLAIAGMPSLYQVCVWDAFNLDSIQLNTQGSPNANFTTECITEIEEINQTGLTIFPNPVSKLLSIEAEYTGHYSVEIISINGLHIFTGEMEGTSKQIDLSSFQNGVYFITIRSKDFVTTRKVIKL